MQVITADKHGRTDGPAHNMLLQVNSKLPIVLMAKTDGFVFNDELLKLGKYILFEFSELGWDWEMTGTHIWGKNTQYFLQFSGDEYKKFDDWVAANPPVLTFTRELLKKDVTENHIPIDYPCWYAVQPPQSKEEFEARPISVFNFWGRSHEERLRLHADFWLYASERGYSMCDNPYYMEKFLQEESGKKLASFWMPHYYRIDMKELFSVSNLSKLTFSLPGAGVKTFRHVEASYNSIMVKWEDELAWSYPWKDSVNCFETTNRAEFYDVEEILQADLYDVYCAGVENCKNYQIDRYIKDYIEKNINHATT